MFRIVVKDDEASESPESKVGIPKDTQAELEAPGWVARYRDSGADIMVATIIIITKGLAPVPCWGCFKGQVQSVSN